MDITMDVDEPASVDTVVSAVVPNSTVDLQANSSFIQYLKTKIPLEMLLRLVDYLDGDFKNLRKTCRDVEKALLPSFQKRFFTSRRVRTSLAELERLNQISESPRLREHVRSIEVRSQMMTEQDPSNEDRDISDTGLDRDMLIQAFQNFPNLETVKVFSTMNLGPFHAECERKLFRSVLFAAARAQDPALPSKVKTFEVVRSGGSGGGISALNLNLSRPTLRVVGPLLGSLKSLTLALEPSPAGRHGQAHVDAISKYVLDFLSHTRLDLLRLNMDRNYHTGCEAIMSALSSKTDTPALDSVTELHLGKMTVRPGTLVNAISRFGPQLKRLILFRVGLILSDNNDKDRNLWKETLKRLAAHPRLNNLNNLQVAFLTQLTPPQHVGFRIPGEPDDSTGTTPIRSYAGLDVQRMISKLSDEIVLPQAARKDRPDSDDDEDDEEESESESDSDDD